MYYYVVLACCSGKLTSCTCVACVQVLLVTSRKAPNVWVVPGGGMEQLEDERTAATRELLEEAGARGSIRRFVGKFSVSAPGAAAASTDTNVLTALGRLPLNQNVRIRFGRITRTR